MEESEQMKNNGIFPVTEILSVILVAFMILFVNSNLDVFRSSRMAVEIKSHDSFAGTLYTVEYPQLTLFTGGSQNLVYAFSRSGAEDWKLDYGLRHDDGELLADAVDHGQHMLICAPKTVDLEKLTRYAQTLSGNQEKTFSFYTSNLEPGIVVISCE